VRRPRNVLDTITDSRGAITEAVGKLHRVTGLAANVSSGSQHVSQRVLQFYQYDSGAECARASEAWPHDVARASAASARKFTRGSLAPGAGGFFGWSWRGARTMREGRWRDQQSLLVPIVCSGARQTVVCAFLTSPVRQVECEADFEQSNRSTSR
jgi:hypothetical protein